jgi:hypothetical protein
MIHEVHETRQVPGEGFRRWFTDSDFDLIVWYGGRDASAPVEGFQLCYDKQDSERALTWRSGLGFSHEKVDDGESGRSVQSKMTPILVPDGIFDAAAVARRLGAHTAEMDPKVARFVLRTLSEYPRPG